MVTAHFHKEAVRAKVYIILEEEQIWHGHGFLETAYQRIETLVRSKSLHHVHHEIDLPDAITDKIYPDVVDFYNKTLANQELSHESVDGSLTGFINREVDRALLFGV